MAFHNRSLFGSLLIMLSVSLGTGCFSSSYIPRANGRLTTVMEDGSLAYRRDGRLYKAGLFNGELEKAVKGVPAAERAARSYRRRVGPGLLGYLGGMTCSLVAARYVDTESEGGLDRNSKIAIATSLACAAGSVVGVFVFASGIPYQHDAINIFNDSVPPDGPVYLPGQARGATE